MQPNGISYMDTNNTKTKIPNEIHSTNDYSIFKTVKGNRKIYPKHVANLMSSILKKNMLAENPILVNESMEIIDGQHRLQAAKGLSIPIYYLILDAGKLAEVQQLNSYTRTWMTQDYLDSYISTGSPKYIELKEFLNEYGFSIEAGFNLLFGDSRGDVYREFREGKFNFTDEQMEAAKAKGDLILDIRSYFVGGAGQSNFFYRTISIIYDKGLAVELANKVKVANPRLQRQWSVRDYLRMFEDVLNWNKKGGEITRLF